MDTEPLNIGINDIRKYLADIMLILIKDEQYAFKVKVVNKTDTDIRDIYMIDNHHNNTTDNHHNSIITMNRNSIVLHTGMRKIDSFKEPNANEYRIMSNNSKSLWSSNDKLLDNILNPKSDTKGFYLNVGCFKKLLSDIIDILKYRIACNAHSVDSQYNKTIKRFGKTPYTMFEKSKREIPYNYDEYSIDYHNTFDKYYLIIYDSNIEWFTIHELIENYSAFDTLITSIKKHIHKRRIEYYIKVAILPSAIGCTNYSICYGRNDSDGIIQINKKAITLCVRDIKHTILDFNKCYPSVVVAKNIQLRPLLLLRFFIMLNNVLESYQQVQNFRLKYSNSRIFANLYSADCFTSGFYTIPTSDDKEKYFDKYKLSYKYPIMLGRKLCNLCEYDRSKLTNYLEKTESKIINDSQ